MDITLLDKKTIKIKIKKVNFVIDPKQKMAKTNADCVITFDIENADLTRVTDYRVLIKGPGEYEVGGVKVIGTKFGESLCYSFITTQASVIIGSVKSLEKMLDKIGEHNVAILNVDSKINPSIITTIEPSSLVLYGDKAKEELPSLSKELLEKKTEHSQKVSINEEKTQEEIELVVLG